MRENRTSGSEGGAAQTNALSLPLSQMLRIGIYTEPKALSECGGLTPLFDSRDPARRKKMSFKLRTACAQKREVWSLGKSVT